MRDGNSAAHGAVNSTDTQDIKNMSVTCATFWYFCAVLVPESAKEKMASLS